MTTLILLAVIYLAFISLGLPDSILGVSFPAMQAEWGLDLSTAGVVSLFITGSTIISSFISGYIIKKIGTAKTTFISCILTAASLAGFSLSPQWYWLLFFAVPLGLGGGSVDTALNNYVALNYKARHMNWLHSFWGIGATLGPLIMSYNIQSSSWRKGYFTIALLQLSLAVILLASIPLWKKTETDRSTKEGIDKTTSGRRILKTPGIPGALSFMLFYCAAEISTGLWGSSYLIQVKKLNVEAAASLMAMYYGGITSGRILSGFISMKLSNQILIRIGLFIAAAGSILLIMPLPQVITGFSILLIGLGLAPIFPAMLHETPNRFGRENSQIIIGYQMGFAYCGSAFFPPLLGIIIQNTSMRLFPYIITGIILLIILLSEKLNNMKKNSIRI